MRKLRIQMYSDLWTFVEDFFFSLKGFRNITFLCPYCSRISPWRNFYSQIFIHSAILYLDSFTLCDGTVIPAPNLIKAKASSPIAISTLKSQPQCLRPILFQLQILLTILALGLFLVSGIWKFSFLPFKLS